MAARGQLDTERETAYVGVRPAEGGMMANVSMKDREELMQMIADPGKRKSLRANPGSAKKGGDADELVDVLASMSDDELAAIAKLNKKMVDMGLTEKGSTVIGFAV
jgi:hypothetical protein